MANEIVTIVENPTKELDFIQVNILEHLTKVAHENPRNITSIISAIESEIFADKETALECFYIKPATGISELSQDLKNASLGKNKSQLKAENIIVGESVRFAEIVAANWAHLQIRVFIKSETNTIVTATCECYDAQNNRFLSIDVPRSIASKGIKYSDSMVQNTRLAAQKIAFRNGLFTIIPKSTFASTIAKIKQVAMSEDPKPLAAQFTANGVTTDELCNYLQLSHLSELNNWHAVILRGLINQIKNGSETIDSIFRTKFETDIIKIRNGNT